jgi:hypothetical protein
VVSDPQYASGCPIPREPLWELESRDPSPRAPEETVSPRGVPEMPGGRDSVKAGSGPSRDDSRGGGPPQVAGQLTRVKLAQDRPPIGPAVEPSREEEIFSLDPPSGTDTPLPATLSLEDVYGPVPWEVDLFLALPLEPVQARNGSDEARVQGGPLTPAPSLALLRPGEQWEVEVAPRPRRGRSPPAALVELSLPQPGGDSRRVILAFLGRW